MNEIINLIMFIKLFVMNNVIEEGCRNLIDGYFNMLASVIEEYDAGKKSLDDTRRMVNCLIDDLRYTFTTWVSSLPNDLDKVTIFFNEENGDEDYIETYDFLYNKLKPFVA